MKKIVKKLFSALLVVVMLLSAAPLSGIASFSFFTNANAEVIDTAKDKWTTKGAAYYDSSNDYYVLTPDSYWTSGSMWFNTPVNSDFSLSLDYYSGSRKDGGADGLAVVFYNNGNSTSGNGESMMYSGLTGYAVELDTYYNGHDPTTSNHISINNSKSNHLAWTYLSESEDNAWHNLRIVVSNKVCYVYVDNNLKISYETAPTGYGYLGITSATGSSKNLHAVKNVNVYAEQIIGTYENYVITVIEDGSRAWISDIIVDSATYHLSLGLNLSYAEAEAYRGKKVKLTIKDEEVIEIKEDKGSGSFDDWYFNTTKTDIGYGVEKSGVNKEGEILEATNVFVARMEEYLSSLGEYVTEDIDYKKIADDLKEKDPNFFTFIEKIPDDASDSLYYALAKFIIEVAEENKLCLSYNNKKSVNENAINMINTLSSGMFSGKYNYRYKKYDVTFDVSMYWSAFYGTVKIEKFKGDYVKYDGNIVSSEDYTTKAMVSYINNLGDIVKDECTYALSSILNEFKTVTGLAEYEENAIETFFKTKKAILSDNGFGDVCTAFKCISGGYNIVKKFKSFNDAKTWLSYGDNAKTIYDKLKSIEFSDKGIKKRAVKKAVAAIETARKDLLNHLYDYLYEVETGDPDNKTFIEKTKDWVSGLWNKIVIACPVDFEVYDASGNLIGFVDSSDLQNDYIYFTDDIFVKVEGDVKYLYCPDDMNIHLKTIPYEDGEMNVAIEKYNCGEPVDKVVFNEISLTSGVAYDQVIEKNIDLEKDDEIVSDISNIFEVDGQYYNANDSAYINVKCISTTGGNVAFDKQKALGAIETMTAIPDEGYEFSHWLINDVRVSTKSVYSFVAKEDVNVVAVFVNVSDLSDVTGECGDDLVWEFNSITGMLKISGTGDMYDYSDGETPWKRYDKQIKKIIIGDKVTHVGEQSFYKCPHLVELYIGENVKSIGVKAFGCCYNLTNITIPSSVTNIEESAFCECYDLTSITIPDSVTSIGNYAFEDCTGLTNVIIGNGVTSIGSYAFNGCKSLISVNYTGTREGWCRIKFNSSTSNPVCYSKCLYINGDDVGDVAVPNDVTEISQYAFYNCKNLTSITIPDSVTSIGSSAFSGCTSLTSIAIPDSVTSIGSSAFSGCTGLTSIAIPDNVTSIGSSAFSGCSGLTNVTMGNSVKTIDSSAFSGCTGLTSIVIPDSVTSIGNYAFRSCTGLTSITIPENVTSIGRRIVEQCTSLKEVNYNAISASLKRAGSQYSPFRSCTSIKTINIGEKVQKLPKYLFNRCTGLTSVTIGNGVTSISDSVFEDCTGLTSVNYTGTRENWCRIKFSGFYSNPVCYSKCLYINGEDIGNVTVPNDVSEISQYAFRNCTNLTSITIPDSVTSIGNSAFRGCTGLTSITIPDSVTSIGNYAFYNCTGLTDVYYSGSEAQWSEIEIGSDNDALTSSNIHYNASFDTKSFITKVPNSNTVIDNDKNLLHGLSAGLTGSAMGDFITVSDGYLTTITPVKGTKVGTGSTLSVSDNDGKEVDSYTVVIFGDVDGDGWYDGQDAVMVSMLVGGMLTREQVGEAAYMAADCNHDGVVDEKDVELLNQAGTLLSNVDQTLSTEEMLETAAYQEYMELIDQQPTDSVEDNVGKEDNTGVTEDNSNTPTNDEPTNLDLWTLLLTYLEKIFDFIMSIFKA